MDPASASGTVRTSRKARRTPLSHPTTGTSLVVMTPIPPPTVSSPLRNWSPLWVSPGLWTSTRSSTNFKVACLRQHFYFSDIHFCKYRFRWQEIQTVTSLRRRTPQQRFRPRSGHLRSARQGRQQIVRWRRSQIAAFAALRALRQVGSEGLGRFDRSHQS